MTLHKWNQYVGYIQTKCSNISFNLIVPSSTDLNIFMLVHIILTNSQESLWRMLHAIHSSDCSQRLAFNIKHCCTSSPCDQKEKDRGRASILFPTAIPLEILLVIIEMCICYRSKHLQLRVILLHYYIREMLFFFLYITKNSYLYLRKFWISEKLWFCDVINLYLLAFCTYTEYK